MVGLYRPKPIHMSLIYSFQAVAIFILYGISEPLSSEKTIIVQRDWFRFLAEECELDWPELEALPDDAECIESLYPFIYGSIEESTAAFFWIKIASGPETLRHSCFNLDTVALNDDTTYLLNYGNEYDATKLSSLALVYVTTASNGPNYSASNKRRLEELLAGLMDRHDLHESSDGISPLLHMLHDRYTVPSVNEMEARLDEWLTLLKSLGVDLRLYGQEEWRRFQALRRNCDRPWDWRHGVEAHRCEEVADDPRFEAAFGKPESLTAFTFGEEVSDWKLWVLHHGDEHAGQFWRLIEQNGIYHRHVPGGWVEDG
jgi:hypothetical protein